MDVEQIFGQHRKA